MQFPAGLRGQKSVSFLHKRGLPSPPSAQKLAEIKKTAAFGRNVPLADTPLAGPSTRNSDSGSFGGGYDHPRTSTGRGSVDLLSRNSPGDESGLRRRGGSLDMARPSSFLHHHDHPQQQQQESIPEAGTVRATHKLGEISQKCAAMYVVWLCTFSVRVAFCGDTCQAAKRSPWLKRSVWFEAQIIVQSGKLLVLFSYIYY